MTGKSGLRCSLLDLLDQTRLADTGLAAQVEGVATPGLAARRKRRLKEAQFASATDERPPLARSPAQPAEPPGPNRLGKSFDRQGACRGAIEPLGKCAVCLIGHQDFAGRGGAGEPRCEVRRITGHGVFAVTRAAGTAGDDLAAGNADMDADRAADARRHLGDRGLNGQRGARCALGIVVVRNRRAEDCHYAVADVPVDVSAMLLDDAVGAVVELLELGMNLLGVDLLTG